MHHSINAAFFGIHGDFLPVSGLNDYHWPIGLLLGLRLCEKIVVFIHL